MNQGSGVNVTRRLDAHAPVGRDRRSEGRSSCVAEPVLRPTPAISTQLTGPRLRQALAKRRDEQLLRYAVELGLFPPADLHRGLAQLHLDGRPPLDGRSSYRVLVDLQRAMARDGLTIATSRQGA